MMGKFRDERYGSTLAEKKITILKMAVDAVKLAKTFVDDVEFYAEDAGRSDPAYLFEMLEAVIDAGATVVNIPDTTGYTVPEQYGALIRGIRDQGARTSIARRSASTATTIWGWPWPTPSPACRTAPARWRPRSTESASGRATRRSKKSSWRSARAPTTFSVHTDVEAREFYRTSRLVAEMLGIPVPPNKAMVGANAFSHSSGIHVDGFLKDRQTYEIMRPEDVGLAGEPRGADRAHRAGRPARPAGEAGIHAIARRAEPGLPAFSHRSPTRSRKSSTRT